MPYLNWHWRLSSMNTIKKTLNSNELIKIKKTLWWRANLNHFTAVCLRIFADSAEDLDGRRFLRPVGQRQRHLAVSKRVRRVWAERQFGPKHGLSLQTRSLPDEQMVVVTLQQFKNQSINLHVFLSIYIS